MTFPKVIYFCNKTLDKMEEYSNNWKRLNPEYQIKLYDDGMCKRFLLKRFGKLHYEIFSFLRDGPIRADFWRICVLYFYGGVYCDIDNEPLMSIDSFLEPGVDFVTCSSYWRYNFNPNFIISNRENPILKKCIDWYIAMYTHQVTYDYWTYSIMNCFTQTLSLPDYKKEPGIYSLDNLKVQIIKECSGKNHYDAHNVYKDIRIFNNRYSTWDFDNHKFKET